MATGLMVLSGVLCSVAAPQLMSVFSSDPEVIAVGVEYLHVIAFSFVASGVVFVTSSMFQALGNTIPPLLTSGTRITLVAIPLLILARVPGFHLKWIWYLSAVGVTLQMIANIVLLLREMRLRFDAPATAAVADQPSLSA
jgi:Na+-driven multidrug efflux pump